MAAVVQGKAIAVHPILVVSVAVVTVVVAEAAAAKRHPKVK